MKKRSIYILLSLLFIIFLFVCKCSAIKASNPLYNYYNKVNGTYCSNGAFNYQIEQQYDFYTSLTGINYNELFFPVPTQILKTVMPSGGDYTTLAACLIANAQNLVTADKYLVVKIDGTWSSANTTAASTTGYTTNSTHYIDIYTTCSSRHKGIYSTSYYCLEVNGTCINITTENVRITGLQIYNTSIGVFLTPAGADINIAPVTNSVTWDIQISNNILKGKKTVATLAPNFGVYSNTALTGISGTVKVWNNIIYNFGTNASSRGIAFEGTTSGFTPYVYNNTVDSTNIGIYDAVGSRATKTVLKNNIVQHCTTDYSGSWGAATDYNVSTDATAPGSTHYKRSKTITFVDASTDNYLLSVSDTIARDKGMDLSADTYIPFNTAIRGNARPQNSVWDIGADEYMSPFVDPCSPAVVNPFKPQIIIIN